MISSLDEAMKDPRFQEFFERIKRTVNYCIATHANQCSPDMQHAIDLCIATAFLEGDKE